MCLIKAGAYAYRRDASPTREVRESRVGKGLCKQARLVELVTRITCHTRKYLSYIMLIRDAHLQSRNWHYNKRENTTATCSIGGKNNEREKLLKRVVGGYEKVQNGNSRVCVRRQPQPRESKILRNKNSSIAFRCNGMASAKWNNIC